MNMKKESHLTCTLLHSMLLFKHGSIEQFTGQGVEKLNDIIRKIHNQKSSRQDACFAALSACERIQILKGHINVKKNKYKGSLHFWAFQGLTVLRLTGKEYFDFDI